MLNIPLRPTSWKTESSSPYPLDPPSENRWWSPKGKVGLCCFALFVQGHPEEELGKRKMRELTCSLSPLCTDSLKEERRKLNSKGTILIRDALGPKTYPVLLWNTKFGRGHSVCSSMEYRISLGRFRRCSFWRNNSVVDVALSEEAEIRDWKRKYHQFSKEEKW